MNRSKRGAARISAVWMIVVIVAFFVAVGVAFVAFDEAGKVQTTLEETRAQLETVSARADEERTQVRAQSEVIGFYDTAAASAKADVEAMKQGLTSLRDAFPDIDPSVQTFQAAVPVVIQSYTARGQRIRDLEAQVAKLQGEVSAKDKTVRDVTSAKDQELAQARSQIQDLEQAMADQKTTLEKQVSSQRAEVSDRDSKLKAALSELDEKTRTFTRERETDRTRMADMSNKLKPILREPEAPDGSLLAVSKELALGWIDRGAHDRLARGTLFRVVSGEVGSSKVKAWAEVTRVDADMAEVRIFDQQDPFDPPVAGDTIFNPVYDPYGVRYAVLAGRFSDPNEAEVTALLQKIGIVVQPALDLTTDFLIVGQEMYVDPDTLEPLEEPLQPSELAVYKDAVANGLAIIPIKDIRQYFKN